VKKCAIALIAILLASSCSDRYPDPYIGESGLAYRNLTQSDMSALGQWCATAPHCNKMTHDDAVRAFEGVAYIMCEAAEDGFPLRLPDEAEAMLRQMSYIFDEPTDLPLFVIGVTFTACPDDFPLATILAQRLVLESP